jgi:class 3 adenylate cyclase
MPLFNVAVVRHDGRDSKPPRTRYARSGRLHIAYQTLGSGSQNVVFVTPWTFCMEIVWEYEPAARGLTALASIGRLVVFDRRGCGLSDPVGRPATLEDQVADVLAVMDAAGAERAAVFAEGDGNPMALVFAAMHPDRVTHLFLHHPFARLTAGDGYPHGVPAELAEERIVRPTVETWGTGQLGAAISPVLAREDPGFVDWWARNERFAASPGTAKGLMRFFTEIDVRDVLSQVRVPTVVALRSAASWPGGEHCRYVAEHIPGARLAELPGGDAVVFGDGGQAEFALLQEFVTGAPPRPPADRVLATVLFTDIVGSTERAAAVGDSRWLEVLKQHDALTAAEIARHGGRLVKTTGDGALITFDGPARGIRAAQAIARAVRQVGVEVRCGLHTGEVELHDGDVAGMAVHVGARVAALAGPGEVLVSKTVKDLVLGSGLAFADRGEHELKGVPDRWRVYAVEDD